MKHTRRKIVLVILIVMCAAFIVAGVFFDYSMRANIEDTATASIRTMMEDDYYEEDNIQMNVNIFIYDTENKHIISLDYYDDYSYSDDYDDEFEDEFEDEFDKPGDLPYERPEIPAGSDGFYLNDPEFYDMYYYSEQEIINYWNNNTTEEKKIFFVDGEYNKYYAAWELEDTGYIMFYYVDVTFELMSMLSTEILLFAVMAAVTVAGCLLGVFVGSRIERDQEKQKQFFENASHELKTPLMVIQGYADGIESGVINDTAAASEIISSEVEKMAGLVDEILCLSRLENGKINLNKEKSDINLFLNECLISMDPVIKQKSLKVTLDSEHYDTEFDILQTERAVRNIISNAVRFAKSEIRLTFRDKKLIIWNDGDPIPKEELNHIFERFYTGKNGNTGIGMALTKEIIEKHGWKISVKNTDGGTGFIIKIK